MPHNFLTAIKQYFPRFHNKLSKYVDSSMRSTEGVLLICPIPLIAEDAFLFSFYPPLHNFLILYSNSYDTQIPVPLRQLYTLFNGATLFHTYIEIWGFIITETKFISPAFDIREESKYVPRLRDKIAFASTNSGDIVCIDKQSYFVYSYTADGQEKDIFKNIDIWLENECDNGHEIYNEYITV